MGPIGFQEMILIALVILLLFGAKRLPEIGRALGQGIREFKKSINNSSDDSSEDSRLNREKNRLIPLAILVRNPTEIV